MNILIVDDQKLLRESLKYTIENNSDIKVIGCVTNGEEAYDFCREQKPDVILMDISMPVCNGTEAAKMIKSKYPEVKILILTASSNESDVSDALANGADGYILKDIGAEELILSIKSTAAGLGIIHREVLGSVSVIRNSIDREPQKNRAIKVNGIDTSISERELKIIEMIVDGNDNKQIGAALFIAEGTVKNMITEIISKLQLKDRTQLAVFAIKNNMV